MPRRPIAVYAEQLREAKRILKVHCSVDYNNELQIRLADEWLEATLDALVDGVDLPPRPRFLRNGPC